MKTVGKSEEVNGMNRNIYRFCLITAIVLAVFTGILYYHFYQAEEAAPKEGTLVWSEFEEDDYERQQ